MIDLLARRREMMGGKKEQADNYIYYDVFVPSANVSRNVWSGETTDIAEMWMDDVQITPIKSMTFATAGTYHMKVLLITPATIPYAALNAGHYQNAILPACVTYIDNNAFRNYWSNSSSSKLTCKAVTPPALNDDPFANRHSVTVYVPSESVTAYQSAWSMMSNIQAII